jgi:hypothetical protein
MSRDIALRVVLMRREVLVLEEVVKVYKASGVSEVFHLEFTVETL